MSKTKKLFSTNKKAETAKESTVQNSYLKTKVETAVLKINWNPLLFEPIFMVESESPEILFFEEFESESVVANLVLMFDSKTLEYSIHKTKFEKLGESLVKQTKETLTFDKYHTTPESISTNIRAIGKFKKIAGELKKDVPNAI